MIDKDKFFPAIRSSLFRGVMDQAQVDGLNALIDGAPFWDVRWLAYALATAFHETATTMQPIAEYGHGLGHAYGNPDPITGQRYYGRGFVQLTWKENYRSMSAVVAADLVDHPELALQPAVAAKVLFYGMEHGSFTGRKLLDFFNPGNTDWVNARRIINGTDRAAMIAGYGQSFLKALQE